MKGERRVGLIYPGVERVWGGGGPIGKKCGPGSAHLIGGEVLGIKTMIRRAWQPDAFDGIQLVNVISFFCLTLL